jgi:ABC-2 type transport system ATP-binding protein
VADKSVKELIGKSSAGQVIVMEFDSEIEESFFSELGLSKIEKIGEKEWRLSSESSEDLRPKLFQLAVDNKLSVLSMKVEAGSLEDVFKKLTKKA